MTATSERRVLYMTHDREMVFVGRQLPSVADVNNRPRGRGFAAERDKVFCVVASRHKVFDAQTGEPLPDRVALFVVGKLEQHPVYIAADAYTDSLMRTVLEDGKEAAYLRVVFGV